MTESILTFASSHSSPQLKNFQFQRFPLKLSFPNSQSHKTLSFPSNAKRYSVNAPSENNYLRQYGNVVHAVIVAQGPHESVAQTGLAHADLALILFRAGKTDDGDVYAPQIVALARHRCDNNACNQVTYEIYKMGLYRLALNLASTSRHPFLSSPGKWNEPPSRFHQNPSSVTLVIITQLKLAIKIATVSLW